MDPGTWERIKEITADALDIVDPAERAVFIDQACAGDEVLRAEVIRMVAACESTEESFLAPPSLNIEEVIRRHIESARTFQAGQLVNKRFRITRFLSEGGMGEVFEAWDNDLQESVALKTIRPGIAPHPSVIERFKREVKQARGIAHPNICPVYELFPALLDSEEEVWFLTMKLLPGETLSQRLARSGPIPLEEALPLAEGLISALAAAHANRIVHSDFKSGNIMLVPTGGGTSAVVTDFGLSLNLTHAPDEHNPKPGEGTAAYLAPERRQGLAISPAADQYALGVVLCEMVTGQRPGQVMPDIQDRRWREAILRCLAPDPAHRFATISDVASALRPEKRKFSWPLLIGATGIAIALLVTFVIPPKEQIRNLTPFTSGTDLSGSPSFSPDGKVLAYMSDRAEQGNEDIWVQRLDGSELRRLTTDPAEDAHPDISPDGRLVAFYSQRKESGVYVVPTAGGADRLMVPQGRDPHFSPDGRSILYWVGDADERVAGSRLYLIPTAGGTPQRLVPEFADARLPIWNSGGQHILFQGCRERGADFPRCSEWWVVNLDHGRASNTGVLAGLGAAGVELFTTAAVWRGERVLFSGRSGTTTNIYSVGISPSTLRLTSAAKPITSGENTRDISPSLANNGQIAIGRLSGAMHIWNVPLTTGTPVKVTNDAALDASPYVSRNGRWLVFSRSRRKPSQLWVKDLRTGVEEVLFTSPFSKISPLISESGQTVVFEDQGPSGTSVHVAARGAAASRLLCTGCTHPSTWIEDGRLVAAQDQAQNSIVVLNTQTGASHALLADPAVHLDSASWSPQNRLLAFTATWQNHKQIFVASVTSLSPIARNQWTPVTLEVEWSDKPTWSLDGSTLYYVSARDGSQCIWSQPFNPKTQTPSGASAAVVHLHNQRLSPMRLSSMHFNVAAAPGMLYFNLGEASETIWTGTLARPDFSSFLHGLFLQ